VILPQPGKRELRERSFDKQTVVYRFLPSDDRAMQWEALRVFKTPEEAKEFAFPRKAKKAA
jgi:hypothetical protein